MELSAPAYNKYSHTFISFWPAICPPLLSHHLFYFSLSPPSPSPPRSLPPSQSRFPPPTRPFPPSPRNPDPFCFSVLNIDAGRRREGSTPQCYATYRSLASSTGAARGCAIAIVFDLVYSVLAHGWCGRLGAQRMPRWSCGGSALRLFMTETWSVSTRLLCHYKIADLVHAPQEHIKALSYATSNTSRRWFCSKCLPHTCSYSYIHMCGYHCLYIHTTSSHTISAHNLAHINLLLHLVTRSAHT